MSKNQSQPRRASLRIIDAATGSFKSETVLDIPDEILDRLIDEERDPGVTYDFDNKDYIDLCRELELTPLEGVSAAKLIFRRPGYVPDEKSHTGRELRLMLEQKKPLAAFAVGLKEDPMQFVPENEFSPYVETGEIIRKEFIQYSSDTMSPGIRRIMYVLRGQEWRADAYDALWRIGYKYGWTAELERVEGYLLGYETDIDQFFSAFTNTKS